MTTFSIGDGDRVKCGPMQHLHVVVVYFHEEDGSYLVRFGASQQMYYRQDGLEHWP